FLNYVIDKSKVVFKGLYSSIYQCNNLQYSDFVMICRIFEPTSLIDPQNDLYLRILRHIGLYPNLFVSANL
ncbi:hypothetical protein QIH36_27140, partial [Klebsiella pneumoniae]|nr:hypothetical protein [Klebsiella pneumoniae]